MTVNSAARADQGMPGRKASHRIVWFADLETLFERLDLLELLRDELGLTTVMLERHLSHTCGFTADAAATGPTEDWRQRTYR